jgi:hypothetical protein
VRVDVVGRDGRCVPIGPLSYGSTGRSSGKRRSSRLGFDVGGDVHGVRTGSRRARNVTAAAVANDKTFTDESYPASSTDDDALPLDGLVLDPADALDPAFSVDGTFASVDPGTEDTFGGFVTDDLSPLTLSVLEQVSSGQDGRRRVVNGLNEGAAGVDRSASNNYHGRIGLDPLDVVLVNVPKDHELVHLGLEDGHVFLSNQRMYETGQNLHDPVHSFLGDPPE